MNIPREYARAKIFGIDPGRATCGLAVLEISPASGTIMSAYARTISSHRVNAYTGLVPDLHADKIIMLEKLKMELAVELQEHRPWAVGCESPFYNPRMPSAYGSLTEVVSGLQTVCLHYNPNIKFELISPQSVKQGVGVAGQKGKEVVKQALLRLPELTSVLCTPIETLDEHAIDALAVSLTLVKNRLFH